MQMHDATRPGKAAVPPIYSTLADDPDLAELANLFAQEMPGRIENLRQQFETANWEQLGRAAHQLKGAAGSYGFEPLTPASARLEMAVRNQAPEQEIERALEDLIALCSAATPTG